MQNSVCHSSFLSLFNVAMYAVGFLYKKSKPVRVGVIALNTKSIEKGLIYYYLFPPFVHQKNHHDLYLM